MYIGFDLSLGTPPSKKKMDKSYDFLHFLFTPPIDKIFIQFWLPRLYDICCIREKEYTDHPES